MLVGVGRLNKQGLIRYRVCQMVVSVMEEMQNRGQEPGSEAGVGRGLQPHIQWPLECLV